MSYFLHTRNDQKYMFVICERALVNTIEITSVDYWTSEFSKLRPNQPYAQFKCFHKKNTQVHGQAFRHTFFRTIPLLLNIGFRIILNHF